MGSELALPRYRADIDGLRALAVLPVVIFHVDPSLIPGGYLGVDIFFVISGYLISSLLFREQTDNTFSFLKFYGRRIRRLFPALALVLAASLIFGYFALLPDEYERLGIQAASAIAFVLNLRLIGEAGYFDSVSYSKPLLHLWSLSVEEQFYVVWPVILLLFRRVRGWGILLVVCAICSFGYAIFLGRSNPDSLYYHPLTRFWELLAGAALAYASHQRLADRLPAWCGLNSVVNSAGICGLILIMGSLFFMHKGVPHPGVFSILPIVGSVLLIACGNASKVGQILSQRPLVLIGLCSYPLYLWHWPILSFLRIVESGSAQQSILWIGALGSGVLAWGTYRWIEVPIRQSSRRVLVTATACSVMAVLAIASVAIVAEDGLPQRQSIQYLKKYDAQMVREARQDDSCLRLFSGHTAPVYCRQHKPGPRMIGLIGDSHAHVLFSGVSELAEREGLGTLLLANSGCPPLLGAVTGRNSEELKKCATSVDHLLESIVSDKRIVSVVIASRGPQYINGLGFGPVEANYSYPPITTEKAFGSGVAQDAAQVFANGLAATAEKLHAHGLRVSYLLQVPELGVPAQSCLGKRPFTLAAETRRCTVDYKEYASRMAAYRTLVAGVAKRAPYLTIIDVENLFCSADGCSGFKNEQLLYADDNHLSVMGSQLVAPIVVKAALGPPPKSEVPIGR